MAKVTFLFETPTGIHTPIPYIVGGIDLDGDGNIDAAPEQQLLNQTTPNHWEATWNLGEEDPTGILFVVKFFVGTGTAWQFRIIDGSKKQLYPTASGWQLGTTSTEVGLVPGNL